MKAFSSLTFILLLSVISTLAQRNVIKANLSAAALGNAYLTYERTIAKQLSLNLGLSFIPSRKIPFADQFKEFNGNQSPLKSMKVSGWAVTPEFRFYTNILKGSPRGFYVAPYLRMSQYTFSKNDYEYTYNNEYYNNTKMTARVDFSGSVASIGGGVMIGHQWIIGKHFSIDFWILGLGINSTKINLKASSDEMDPRYFASGSPFSDEIRKNMEFLNSIDTKSGANYVENNSQRVLPGLRGLGFNIGLAF